MVLVSMPWASCARPNLGLGILAAIAKREGLECKVLFPCLAFGAQLGAAYEPLAETPGLFALCEHVFAVDVFGREALGSEEFLGRSLRGEAAGQGAQSMEAFRYLRDVTVPAFLGELVQRIVALGPQVVGFSCTFNQALPSLAAARRL
jgi:hypothetical protein